MEKKKTTLANFNITFGKDEEPMLNYFDSIIYPAFNSGIYRKYYDDLYLISECQIVELEENEPALIGYFIKKTKVEVKSTYENNELVNKDDIHPSAPFSTFVILLKNHRMFLIKNQRKDSPDIRSFNTTVRSILKSYIRNANKNINKKDKKLPDAIVNIIGLPSTQGIMKRLESVEKITQFTMRLYPLNDDLPGTDLEDQLISRLEKLGANTGSTVINSPTNKTELAEVITKTEGRAEPILNVVYAGGGTGSIKNNFFTENIELPVGSDSTSIIAQEAYNHLKDRDELNVDSEKHRSTLRHNIDNIRKYLTTNKQ